MNEIRTGGNAGNDLTRMKGKRKKSEQRRRMGRRTLNDEVEREENVK